MRVELEDLGVAQEILARDNLFVFSAARTSIALLRERRCTYQRSPRRQACDRRR